MSRRAVTREQIVAAADSVARREGIDGLTVRRLCAELGVTAPAVYRHYLNKEQIVDEVVDRVIERIELPGPEAGDWAERIRRCFVSAHDEVAPYGGLAARMSHAMPKSMWARRNSAYLFEVLSSAGIDDDDAVKIIYAVFVYIWGHLLSAEAAQMIAPGPRSLTSAREQFLWGLDHLLDAFRREFAPRRRRGMRRVLPDAG